MHMKAKNKSTFENDINSKTQKYFVIIFYY